MLNSETLSAIERATYAENRAPTLEEWRMFLEGAEEAFDEVFALAADAIDDSPSEVDFLEARLTATRLREMLIRVLREVDALEKLEPALEQAAAHGWQLVHDTFQEPGSVEVQS